MATDKPRLTITLPVNIHETVTRLAELQGVSKSAIIVDFLGSVHPPLMRTVALLEAARDAPDNVKRGMVETLEAMEREFTKSANTGMEQLDWLHKNVTGSGSLGGSDPHVVTRGSGSGSASAPKDKKPLKTRSKPR